jgi:hypothetical protein
MVDLVKSLLGLGNGSGIASKALGTFNILALAPLGIWLYAHRDEQVTFTLSLGTLAVLAVLLYAFLEINRRSEYRSGTAADRQP